MALTITDGGRQLIASGNTSTPVSMGPRCNMKIIDGWWQDTAAAGDTLVFQDSVGRVFSYKASTDLVPIAIGKLDWFAGPITITQMSSGNLYIILGNK